MYDIGPDGEAAHRQVLWTEFLQLQRVQVVPEESFSEGEGGEGGEYGKTEWRRDGLGNRKCPVQILGKVGVLEAFLDCGGWANVVEVGKEDMAVQDGHGKVPGLYV